MKKKEESGRGSQAAGHSASEGVGKDSKSQDKSLLWKLGPGLITGAADDDPSGIATYSQVGARYGYGMLWTMLFSFPLMAAFQEISARIGRVSGIGIAGNIRRHYARPYLYGIVSLLLIANIFNIGADIGAMGAAARLLLPGPQALFVLVFGFISLLLQILIPYTKYVKYLKWLTAALFAYVATALSLHEPRWAAVRATFMPPLSLHGGYITALIAILGTTISPYLFFWQASEEVEDVTLDKGEKPLKNAPEQAPAQLHRIRYDTYFGMAFSNIVAFFVILTAAASLHAHGIQDIQTADQAARALEPLAGRFAFFLFALGIVGTGLLAVPVLAGSAAYGVSETFQWTASLEKETETRDPVLRDDRCGDFDRPASQLPAFESDQGAILVGGAERYRSWTCYGVHDVAGAKSESHGAIYVASIFAGGRMAGNRRDDFGFARNVCNDSSVILFRVALLV